MEKHGQLETLTLDVEKGICELNGIDISKNTSELHLDFEHGKWQLTTTRTTTYIASCKSTKE